MHDRMVSHFTIQCDCVNLEKPKYFSNIPAGQYPPLVHRSPPSVALFTGVEVVAPL